MIPNPRNHQPEPDSVVLDILSDSPRLELNDLYQRFLTRYPKGMSLPGFYKVINKMRKQQVLVKVGKQISIDASWIYNLTIFLDKVQNVYFGQESSSVNLILTEGDSREFQFESIIEADNFWAHALTIYTLYYSNKDHPDKDVCMHLAHNWFMLVRTEQESTNIQAYKEHGMDLYHVYPSDSFLDSIVPDYLKDEHYHLRQDTNQNFPSDYYGMVMGDFIIEMEPSPFATKAMDALYKKVTSMSEFNSQEIMDLIEDRNRTKLRISRDSSKAKAIRASVKSIF